MGNILVWGSEGAKRREGNKVSGNFQRIGYCKDNNKKEDKYTPALISARIGKGKSKADMSFKSDEKSGKV